LSTREMRDLNCSPSLGEDYIESLRVLFDILDTDRDGFVSYNKLLLFSHPSLPPDFLNLSATLTDIQGNLSFDRFVAAIRLSLQNDNDANNNNRLSIQKCFTAPPIEEKESKHRRACSLERRTTPLMGVNGFDRRSIYGSQPAVNDASAGVIPSFGMTVNRRSMVSLPAQISPQGSLGSSNGSSSNSRPPPPDYDNFANVVMRKKPSTVRAQKEESNRARNLMNGSRSSSQVRARPLSVHSVSSVASSGLEGVNWRSSVASAHSPPTIETNRRSSMHDEMNDPRVAKIERLHAEEEEIIQKGLEKACRLVDWYKERRETIEKRQRLLHKGVVSLDTSVPEQRLNFLRAHVSELNRKTTALMESSERGFPSHLTNRSTPVAAPSVIISAPSSKAPSPSVVSMASEKSRLDMLEQQNRVLSHEIIEKTRQIDQLKRESTQFTNNNTHHSNGTSALRMQPGRPTTVTRPSAFVRPAPTIDQYRQPTVVPKPVKVYDTLM
ncbi:hypothetical protein PENTCL1PPCAC_26350, partial [Pristionchus entomophagus]